MQSRTHISRYLSLLMVPMLLLLLLLTGCSTTSGTTVNSTGSPGTSPSPTATTGGVSGGGSGDTGSGSNTPVVTAPQHAFAWSQYDNASTPTPQIWASINGGIPRQITHLPPITSGCDTQIEWGLPVFSSNLTRIVASIGSANCGDGGLQGPIDIIAVSTGAITPIPVCGEAYDQSSERTDGWLNDSTIFFANNNGLWTYSLGAGCPVQVLPASSQPFEAILRGSILFWEQDTFNTLTNNWATTLHRYDFATHATLPGSISLGQVHDCQCSPGDFNLQGWDVSPDGSHIVYQVTTPLTGSNFGVATSAIYYANADGSGATQIARYMSTNQPVRLQISPNGQLVAFSNALPSPSVISAGVNSPGNVGDPNFHAYTPDATSFPVWKWNSSSFWASSGGEDEPGTAIHYFTVGASGSVIGVNHGFNPWYTIVS